MRRRARRWVCSALVVTVAVWLFAPGCRANLRGPEIAFLGYTNNSAGERAAIFTITNSTRRLISYEPIENLADPRRFGSPPSFLFPGHSHTVVRRLRQANSVVVFGVWCCPAKRDPVTLVNVMRDWFKARKWSPILWVPYLKPEKAGYAVWASASGKTQQESALLAPCVALEFMLAPDSRELESRKMPQRFKDSATFYSFWNVFDTLRDPRVRGIMTEEEKTAADDFRHTMSRLPW